MKFMNLKEKFLPMNLQLFAEDGEADGDDSGEGDDPDGEEPDEDGEDEDEKKFSQKEVDEAVKKRLAREKRKWQRQQQTKPDDKPRDTGNPGNGDTGAAGETEADKKAREAEEKAAALEMKWTCLEHDVRKDCVDDVLALAKVHTSKDDSLDIEDAIDKVLEKYPHFKDGYDQDDDQDDGQKKGWGQRHGKPPKKSETVEDEIRKQLFGK